MINFKYSFNHPSYTSCDYYVRQFKMGGAFEVFSITDTPIGDIWRLEDGWEQRNGRMMLQELVDGIGKYIDDNKLWS